MKKYLPMIFLLFAVWASARTFAQEQPPHDPVQPKPEAVQIETVQKETNSPDSALVAPVSEEKQPEAVSPAPPVEMVEPKIVIPEMVTPKLDTQLKGPSKVQKGEHPTFTFVVSNSTETSLPPGMLLWKLPKKDKAGEIVLQANTASKGYKVSECGNFITWDVPELKPGDTKTFSIQYAAERAGKDILSAIYTDMETENKKIVARAMLPVVVESQESLPDEGQHRHQLGDAVRVMPDEDQAHPILTDTVETVKLPGVAGLSLASIAQLPSPEKRIRASIKWAALQAEIYGPESVEPGFNFAIDNLTQVEDFELKMTLLREIAQQYHELKNRDANDDRR